MKTVDYKKDLHSIKFMKKMGNWIFWISWLIWLLQTVYFILIFGYHTGPINANEKTLDSITGFSMGLGIFFIFMSMSKQADLFVKLIED